MADGAMVAAVRRDLAMLAERDPALADGALAQLALAMAAEIDDPDNTATAKSMCAARLSDALDRLRDLAPPAVEHDRLDEVSQRREQRRRTGRAADA